MDISVLREIAAKPVVISPSITNDEATYADTRIPLAGLATVDASREAIACSILDTADWDMQMARTMQKGEIVEIGGWFRDVAPGYLLGPRSGGRISAGTGGWEAVDAKYIGEGPDALELLNPILTSLSVENGVPMMVWQIHIGLARKTRVYVRVTRPIPVKRHGNRQHVIPIEYAYLGAAYREGLNLIEAGARVRISLSILFMKGQKPFRAGSPPAKRMPARRSACQPSRPKPPHGLG